MSTCCLFRSERHLGNQCEDDEPDSVTPRKKRATKKPVMLWHTPISVATTPQAIVRVGSQKRGVVLLRIMLQGIYLRVSKDATRSGVSC